MCTLEQSTHINNYEYEPARGEEGVSVPRRYILSFMSLRRGKRQQKFNNLCKLVLMRMKHEFITNI